MARSEMAGRSGGSEPTGVTGRMRSGGATLSWAKLAKHAGCKHATRGCASCVGRSLRITVGGEDVLANRLPRDALTQQARCWTWHFLESDCCSLASLRFASPDVLVMPATLDGTSRWRCARQLKAHLPELRVLMLAEPSEKTAILHALQGGAFGCLVLPVFPGQLACAVAALASGQPALCAKSQAVVLEFLHGVGRASGEAKLGYMEHQVMQLLALGKVDKEITTQLGLSDETVHSHLHHIYKKLAVHNRNDARSKYLRLYGGGGGG